MQIMRAFFSIAVLLVVIHEYGFAESLLLVKDIEQRPFSLSASQISTWKKDGIRVFVANKDVRILQVPFQITADTAVCWFHEEEAAQHTEATMEVYCEGNVTILQDENYEKYEQVYLKFETMTGIAINSDDQPIETFEKPQETEAVLRGEEIRSLKKEEYLSTEIPQKVPVPGAQKKEEMVDIIANNIDSWEEGDRRIVVALGDVKIKKEDMTIDADSVILWFEKTESDKSKDKDTELPLSEIYAEGNVTMRRKKDVVVADKMFEDRKEDKGIFINSKIKTIPFKQPVVKQNIDSERRAPVRKSPTSTGLAGVPVYVGGEEIKQVGKGQYEIKNGIVTSCGYGHPHYHFKGKRIRLIQRGEHNIVSSSNNSAYLDKYPVAYFPYLSLDMQKKEPVLKDWLFGNSSRYGRFIKTEWDLFALTGGSQKDWSNLTLNLDYMQKRGPGTGLDFEYKGQDAFGYVDTYYVKDHWDHDINNIPIEHEDRGTILWRHRQELPYDWRLDMEYSYLSDPTFLREYFDYQFKTQKDRETVLYLRRTNDTTAATFLINEQFNGFDTTVDSLREKRYSERLPEAAYRIIGEPFWDNRLIFTSESSATYFDGTFDQKEVTKLDPEFTPIYPTDQPVKPVTRIDNVNRVSMPFKPWFFNVNPFVEGRTTGYTESIDTSGTVDKAGGPATGRFISTFGLDLSSTHWRSYSIYNDFFKINRLRHVFIPELRCMYSPVVTKDPNDLYQHDAIDALDSSGVVAVGVKNKFQTKRGEPGYEKTVDFIDFNVEYYMFPTHAGLYNDGINGIVVRKDNFVNIDFRSQLTDTLAFVSERNEYNTETFQFDVLTSGFQIYNPPDWQYFIGQRYIRDISSTLILAADYKISEKWSMQAGEAYDFNSLTKVEGKDGHMENKPRNLKTNLMLYRYFHDWVGILTLSLDPIRNNNSYSFNVSPKGSQQVATRRFMSSGY